MSDQIYLEYPGVVSGYELSRDSYFWVVIPEATINLVSNPSLETGLTTGYGSLNSTIAITTAWQAFGTYGLSITPNLNSVAGAYYGTIPLTAGSTYTLSAFILGEKDRIYYIWCGTTGGALVGSVRKWIGTGFVQRIWVTYTETSTTTRRIYIAREAYADQHVFYADAFQAEAKTYPTTYCDGDQLGFVVGEKPPPYSWLGTPRASSSSRSAGTRSGGREVRLSDLGFHVLAVPGLGMAPVVDQAIPLPGYGEYPQGTGTTARDFTLVGSIAANSRGNPASLQRIRNGLINAFRPDYVPRAQSLLLRYRAVDDCGEQVGEELDIRCKYLSGLEGPYDNHHQERIPITFRMHSPFLTGKYSNGVSLGFITTVANFANIGYRSSDGQWHAMGTGANGQVNHIVIGPDGYVYAVGSFTTAGGVTVNRIARWDGTVWTALGSGLSVTYGNVMAFSPAEVLYVGGNFATANGVTVNGICYWNGTTFVALGTGVAGLSAAVDAMAFDTLGNLYIGGSFTSVNSVSATRIAKWNGTVWTGGITGADNSIYAMIYHPTNGRVYVGGALTGGIKQLLPGGSALFAVGGSTNGTVYAMDIGPDGNLYIGGNFTVAGTVAAANLAMWDGAAWHAIGDTDGDVTALKFGADGSLYVGGYFSTIGGITVLDRFAVYKNGVWLPPDIDLPNVDAFIDTMAVKADGTLYIGGLWTGSNALSAVVTTVNEGGARAYPTFVFTGPGQLWQLANYTTDTFILFEDLILQAGEVATLVLQPDKISFTSTFRGNLLPYLLHGYSNLNWFLTGGPDDGSNSVSVLMTGTTAASSATMHWRDLYWSPDGAAQ